MKIHISTDFIKLDALLKFSGAVGTGGEAKQAIASELVSVNGEICTMRGKKLRKGDKIVFNGTEITIE